MKKVAIIGGGAAGMMVAITAAREGLDVTIFEHNKSVGKKILASGNGRCNIINTTASHQDYFGANPNFVDIALESMSFKKFEQFCLSIGLILDIKDDGRCYPLSNEAKSVVQAMHNALTTLHVKLFTEQKVVGIQHDKNCFQVETQEKRYPFDMVLIATGSEAAPQLGATADGYTFAQSFGHTIVPTYPSLVQLHLQESFVAKMAGVKMDAEVTLYVNAKKEQSVQGDILFTRYGISGFSILDISQSASQNLSEYAYIFISLNLLPRYNRQALSTLIEKLVQALPQQSIQDILGGILPLKIIPSLLQSAKIEPTTLACDMGMKSIKKITHTIQDWRFDVSGTHGFKHAEVSGGGVNCDEIDEKSMESKLQKGLFFAGEVIDIVGKRGGYNFNFAWASGMLAAKAISKHL